MLGPTGVDERLTATLAFPGGVLGLMDCGFDLVDPLGARGDRLDTDRSAPRTRGRGSHHASPCGATGACEVIEFEPTDHYRLELEDLDRAIRGEASRAARRADAVGQARTIAAIALAAASSEPGVRPMSHGGCDP